MIGSGWSIGMMEFPIYGKIKNGNQTTNQGFILVYMGLSPFGVMFIMTSRYLGGTGIREPPKGSPATNPPICAAHVDQAANS